MSLIESNVRGDGRPLRDADRSVLATNRGDPVSVSVVVSAGEEGSYALSAAELATIESERTKEKLRTKADHVANFHRKVVRRLAVERRAAGTVNSAAINNSSTTGGAAGAGAGTAGDDRMRPNGHVYEYDYADTAAGAAFESSGRTLEEEQRALREHSNETLCYRAVKVVGKPGDVRSLSDADTQARIALAAYSYRTP